MKSKEEREKKEDIKKLIKTQDQKDRNNSQPCLRSVLEKGGKEGGKRKRPLVSNADTISYTSSSVMGLNKM